MVSLVDRLDARPQPMFEQRADRFGPIVPGHAVDPDELDAAVALAARLGAMFDGELRR